MIVNNFSSLKVQQKEELQPRVSANDFAKAYDFANCDAHLHRPICEICIRSKAYL